MYPVKKSSSSSSSTSVLCILEQIKLFDSLPETLLRKSHKTKLLFIFVSLLLYSFFLSYSVSIIVILSPTFAFLPATLKISAPLSHNSSPANLSNHVLREQVNQVLQSSSLRHRPSVSSVQDSDKFKSISVLFPDWEVFVIVLPETSSDSVDGLYCFFSTRENSKARFSGVLPLTNLTTFKCNMPRRFRRRRPFFQPVLTKYPEKEEESLIREASTKELIRTNFYVYEALSTENDVVLFAKGVNRRRGFNRPPHELKCVFGDADDANTAVKTPVTTSSQEVFRCAQPELRAFTSSNNKPIKVSIEIMNDKNPIVVPSVAYYNPRRKIAKPPERSLLCASTMVHNVGKYLKEWVMYHSRIGVENFILYDNESDDNLKSVVRELHEQGYNVATVQWPWPKTQEAGFSHNAIYAKDSCKWMMYFDVDEFLFSPSWDKESEPSDRLLKSLLPGTPSMGQLSFRCNDFGPSGRTSHPVEGVTQGYDCYRRAKQQRHKSIVLLEAIDDSLYNVIHHFGLKKTFKWGEVDTGIAVVNHYKYQAWSEFKSKFRRRVSAYVADWKETVNLSSKDRTPGLGVQPVEPRGWSEMFCDVRDDRLKLLNQRWFGRQTEQWLKMAWER
ncbi:glycosyltransferase family 92 protein Os08g0121900-like [Mangifera indica]|uniref:glycosyltransferase family 92 protein Os08g0121900-like n=1 Tax=Mangifera indica TaxID=29780 RepID=UPI001CFB375F|nr:glycosyltransferase family 92 protein Os08g0121900-like [Mangifera indica]